MCLCASGKNRVRDHRTYRQGEMPLQLSQEEIAVISTNFNNISAGESIISKDNFKRNMGLLGLQMMRLFSDRIFNSMDMDSDGMLCLQDFIEYMDTIRYGDEQHRARLSFKLIDLRNVDEIHREDFDRFLRDFLGTWSAITNNHVTQEIIARVEEFLNYLFPTEAVVIRREAFLDSIYRN
jgi:1-phosphatidylinositol-4-phosphate 5-kinase